MPGNSVVSYNSATVSGAQDGNKQINFGANNNEQRLEGVTKATPNIPASHEVNNSGSRPSSQTSYSLASNPVTVAGIQNGMESGYNPAEVRSMIHQYVKHQLAKANPSVDNSQHGSKLKSSTNIHQNMPISPEGSSTKSDMPKNES